MQLFQNTDLKHHLHGVSWTSLPHKTAPLECPWQFPSAVCYGCTGIYLIKSLFLPFCVSLNSSTACIASLSAPSCMANKIRVIMLHKIIIPDFCLLFVYRIVSRHVSWNALKQVTLFLCFCNARIIGRCHNIKPVFPLPFSSFPSPLLPFLAPPSHPFPLPSLNYHYVPQVSFKLTIPLPQTAEFWDNRCTPLCLASSTLVKKVSFFGFEEASGNVGKPHGKELRVASGWQLAENGCCPRL